ncbi:hypothetical protein BBB57_23170 [Kosakonia sacchari]|uniref:glycosyltransferase n=1 Tax=Kosakonia sacchari TaxID=1158459 RepID=UPI0008074766|nr:glycosyltransferase [Kosakonia sacchari]ANR80893.1 hypothetical protein BBB57_23170 [Kosakonia sacchari]
MKNIDIVIPVYKGLDETIACIESVHDSIDPGLVNVIIVNDCSPEIELTEYLRTIAKKYKFVLIENEKNLGFTGTANHGMTYHDDTDVILLNSDVEVVNDWVERLEKIAYSDSAIATVTPYSNNATICSFPNFCEDNLLIAGVSVNAIDNIFSEKNFGPNFVVVPTGVGFCMFMKRAAIKDVGLLDVDTFGRGYGEENDWCQRAIKKGWKNVHALNTFVYHKGGVSFADEQNPRKIRAIELLNKLHPNYTQDVMQFIARDPAYESRLQAYLFLLGVSKAPSILLVSHKLGGGVKKHIADLASFYSEKVNFILLTPGEEENSFKLKLNLYSNSLKYEFKFNKNEYASLIAVLKALNIDLIHYHHTLGYNDCVLALPVTLSKRYIITIHDYYLISHNPTLTDEKGYFIGDNILSNSYHNDANSIQHCLLKKSSYNNWLVGADEVIFPSKDCCNRFKKFAPQIASKSVIAWHPDYGVYPNKYSDNPRISRKGDALKVLVIGALSKEKGADNLEGVAYALRGKKIEFHLMGYAYRQLDSNVITHGPYDEDKAVSLLNEISPDVVWFPAIWPETYSYTLSLAIQNDYPVIVPNIGAFSERVEMNKFARVIQWDSTVEQLTLLFEDLISNADGFFKNDLGNILDSSCEELVPDFYEYYYLSKIGKKDIIHRGDENSNSSIAYEILLTKSINLNKTTHLADYKERIFVLLWKLSQKRFFAYLMRNIPIQYQKKIKRLLSRKPIHEIINRK